MVALVVMAGAADEASGEPKPAKRVPPVFAPIEDDPSLPRVLLIGDSISIGYTLGVRERLAGRANVHRPPANCASTLEGLANLDAWLGDGKWDLIHFNWGLHDLKFLGPNGENLADPEAPDSRRKVPIEDYERHLGVLVKRLQATGAVLVWRTTTPVPEGAKGRVPGDAARYNEVAARVMKQAGVAVHDLFGSVKPRLSELQRPSDVHFTREGSAVIAEETAAVIREALGAREAAGEARGRVDAGPR